MTQAYATNYDKQFDLWKIRAEAAERDRDELREALTVTDAMVERAIDAWNDAAIYSTIELKLRHVLAAALEAKP